MSETEHDSSENTATLVVERFLTELGVMRRLRDEAIVESRLRVSREQLVAAGEDGLANVCALALSNVVVPLAIRLVQLQGAADERRLALEAVAQPPELEEAQKGTVVQQPRPETPEWLGAAMADQIEPGGTPAGRTPSEALMDHPGTPDALGEENVNAPVLPAKSSMPSEPETPSWLPAETTETRPRPIGDAGQEPVHRDVEESADGNDGLRDPGAQLLLPSGGTAACTSEIDIDKNAKTEVAASSETLRVKELPLLPAPLHLVEGVGGSAEIDDELHAEPSADCEPEPESESDVEVEAESEVEVESESEVESEVEFEFDVEVEAEPVFDSAPKGDERDDSDNEAGGEGVAIAAEGDMDSVVDRLATLAFINTDGDPTGEDPGDADEVAGAVAELLVQPVGAPAETEGEIDEREAELLAASFVRVDSESTEAFEVARAVVELIGQKNGSKSSAENQNVESDEAATADALTSDSVLTTPPPERNEIHSAEPPTPPSVMAVEPRRIRVINIAVGKQVLAAPLELVSEVVKPTRTTIASIGGRPVLRIRGEVLPVIDLHAVLGEAPPTSSPVGVAVATPTEPVVLLASEVIDQREIEVRPLDGAAATTGPFCGVSTDDSGAISLLLDVAAIPLTSGPICDERVIELMPAA